MTKTQFQKRKRALLHRRILIVTVVVVLLMCMAALLVRYVLPRYHYNPISKKELGFEEVFSKSIVNIALFGIDAREVDSFSGLSDSIMVLSVNNTTKQVKVISIMRDSFVPIERNDRTVYNKLNVAYQMGGPQLAVKTLNQCYNLDISEYITVNFYGLSDIIDAVGGIDATLTDAEVTTHGTTHQSGINDYIREICNYAGKNTADYLIHTAGYQHLNGVQAVAYSRIRYVRNVWGTTDDYGRTDRQRYVLEQLFEKGKSLEIGKYPKLIKASIPYVQTSLSYTQLLKLATSVMKETPTFSQMRIPQYEFVMDSPHTDCGSVVYYDLAYAAKVIHAYLYDDMSIDEYMQMYPVEKDDWYARRQN